MKEKRYQCSHDLVAKYRLLGEDKFLEPMDGVIYWYQGNQTAHLSKDIVVEVLERVFNAWGKALYFLDFQQTDDRNLAHIQFWFGSEKHLHLDGCPFEFDGASGVLAHAFPRGSGGLSGHIHFDASENWVVSETLDIETGIDFFQVALHEVGHTLGLGHSAIEAAVMYAFYDGTKSVLHEDDVAGVRELYRDFESNKKWLIWFWEWLKSLLNYRG